MNWRIGKKGTEMCDERNWAKDGRETNKGTDGKDCSGNENIRNEEREWDFLLDSESG